MTEARVEPLPDLDMGSWSLIGYQLMFNRRFSQEYRWPGLESVTRGRVRQEEEEMIRHRFPLGCQPDHHGRLGHLRLSFCRFVIAALVLHPIFRFRMDSDLY
jgi:hypothetical protein